MRICGKTCYGIQKTSQVCYVLVLELLKSRSLLNLQLLSAFIRGLLENVSAEINPLRVIRRIKDGLEIPGLKGAVIKILQSSNLQVSLLDDCQRILHSDASTLAIELQKSQTTGVFGTGRPFLSYVAEQFVC